MNKSNNNDSRGKRCLPVFNLQSLLCTTVLFLLSNPLFAGNLDVLKYDNERLTVLASGVSLVELAQQLSDLTDIAIIVTEGADKLVDIDIVDEPFETAIAKISPNHLLKRKVANGKEVIAEVVIMLDDAANTANNTNSNLPTGEPTQEVVVEQENVETGQDQPNTGIEPALNDDKQAVEPQINQ